MSDFEQKELRVFELFHKQLGLVTAGNPERFNACTIGWGSLGTLWTRPGESGAVMTVYLHPARYTNDFLLQNDFFTVSFFPPAYKKALGIMGSRSGRDGDKVAAAGLTPIPVGESVGYQEAEMIFLCRKLYQHPFSKEDMAPEIREYYRSNPRAYPVDENGDWHPHWVYVGEIRELREKP